MTKRAGEPLCQGTPGPCHSLKQCGTGFQMGLTHDSRDPDPSWASVHSDSLIFVVMRKERNIITSFIN